MKEHLHDWTVSVGAVPCKVTAVGYSDDRKTVCIQFENPGPVTLTYQESKRKPKAKKRRSR